MSEEIEPLPAVSEIDRVIDEENTKTFKVKGVLQFLDDVSELFAGCEFTFNNPVPVVDAEGKPLGAADLSIEGKVVVAELFLRYDSPERLSIETKSEPLYMVWNGLEALDNSEQTWRTAYAHVTSIEVTGSKPIDARIEAL